MNYKFKRIIVGNLFVLSLIAPLAKAEEPSKNPPANAEPTEILITGALTPMGLEHIGKPVSIITHKELTERSEPTIGELLSTEPGVSSSYFGPGSSRPIIRGQSKQRVRVIENGLENGDLSSISDDHAVSIDPLTIERVDILRGPSTLLYGSSAIGGVVNMIDQSINQEYIGEPLTGEMDLRKGDDADEEGTGALSLNGQAGKFNWHLSGYYRETDDIQIPGFAESKQLREMEEMEAEQNHEEGLDEEEHHEEEDTEQRRKLENSDTIAKGMKAGTTYIFDKGYIGLAVRLNNSNYGIPGGHSHEGESEDGEEHHEHDEHEHEHEEESVRIDLDQVRVESRGEVELDHSFFRSLRFGSSFSDYEHKELDGDIVSTHFKNKTLETRVELTHQHPDDFEGGMGTQIKYEDFNVTGEEAFLPKTETFTPALFAVEDYRINERTVWQLGGRYEYATVNPDIFQNQDFNMISGSTGIVRNLDSENNYTLGLSVAYSERAPTATELFADGAHLATQSFEIGDQNLSKEKSAGTELVLKKNLGKVTGSVSAFWQHYFDYINLTPNGETEDSLPVYLYGIDRARFWGFESEADYELYTDDIQQFHLYGQVDYVRGENLSDDDGLPRITPLRGKTGVRYTIDDFAAYVEGLFVAEQNKTAEYELPTDNYTLLSAGVSYQLPVGTKDTYEIYLRGTNLTDEEARVHNSFLKDVAPLRGRAMLAGLRIKF